MQENEVEQEWSQKEETYILDVKYEAVTAEVAKQQKHLSQDQRNDLQWILEKYTAVFDGKLGLYPHEQIHLELLPNSKPVHSRAYFILQIHDEVFRRELEHLIQIGVLRKCSLTEWASPTFIIPK